MSMWTHFCRIALHAEPNFWLFFFLVARKKNFKNWLRRRGKKNVGQKHYKKEFLHFALLIFLKKKKEKKNA